MKKRPIALLLCVLMVLSLLPLQAFGEGQFDVTVDGASVSSVTINTFEKKTLTAAGVQAGTCQWQIKYGESWISINGATQPSLDLGYAMIANLLSGDTAVVRCTAGGQVSGEVTVTVDRAAVPTFEADNSEQPIQVLTGAELVSGEIPTVETEAPTETTAPAVDLEALYNDCAAAQEALQNAQSAQAASAEVHTTALAAYEAAAAAEAEALAAYEAAQDSAEAKQAYDAAVAYTAGCKTGLDNAAADLAAKTQAVTDAQAKFDELQTAFALAQNASLMTLDEPGETPTVPTTYTVVINYVFANGNQAASPYTATVAAGSALNVVVNSPSILGYAPDQASVTINESNIQGNITKNVTYNPSEVNYTVKHYQQNVTDDNYTLVETETKQGYTESAVGEGLGKTYAGFYSLLYDTTTKIAADGSTEIEIFYDRYYYLMNFDLDGGYGVEPIYARYGATITWNTPTKPGYAFDGWTPSAYGVTTMPAENRTYKANWVIHDTVKVTVVFWGENPNDEGYSYDHSGTVQAEPGKDFTFSDSLDFVICGQDAHTHTADCEYACGKTEHTHSAEECGYACNKEIHVHDADCYKLTCTYIPHQHSDACFDTCTLESHNHTTGCYQNVGEQTSGLVAGALLLVSKSEGKIHKGDFSTYICIDDTWYYYNGNLTSGTAPTICGKVESDHVHGDSCADCGLIAHEHTSYTGTCYTKVCTKEEHPSHDDSCGYACGKEGHTHSEEVCGLTCGKTEHSHTTSCYQNGAGMDSDLWTLVKSDTVVVAPDGSSIVNVYYDRTEFTLHFRAKNANSDTYGTITAKWGASIGTQWDEKSEQAGTSQWSEKSSAEGPWTAYWDIMPAENRTYYAYQSGSSTSTAYYYKENLNGEYELAFPITAYGSGLTITLDEDFFDLEGFTKNFDKSSKEGARFNNAEFYYDRNSYNLEFMSSGTKLESYTKSVKYEAPLSSYNFTPPYPDNLEPNAYTFGGWYTDQFFQQEMNWDEATMPASDMVLYAKWVPTTHKVNFYLDKDAVGGTPLIDEQIIDHGEKVDNVPTEISNGQYTFVGWFYMENGEEKAFDPNNMPVKKDLNLYGKWSANTLVDYTLKYAVQNEDGTLTYIAEETTGKALALTTKTFEAKTGDELYEGYQSGYFPKEASHSIVMSADEGATNEWTFIYEPKEEVPYTVRYLEVGTETVLHEEKNDVTRDAIITETFVAVTGYMPDAYQKRLVLSADESMNVITFWYVKDDTHAPLHIVHYTQNIEGDGYTVYQESTDINALIGQTYSESPLTIPGFTHNPNAAGTVMSGEMTAEGLELRLYYDRTLYPYEFKFLEQGTDKVLAVSVTGTARYQAQVTQAAKTIPGYTLVSAPNQAINIAIEDPADVAKNNVRIFYYQENDITINYQVVGPEGCGTVTPASETVKEATGTPAGSTATPTSNVYKFVGWYTDPECNTPVSAAQVDANNKFTPAKVNGLNVAATYYAKFEYNLTSMTITKTAASVYDSDDTFIFDVTATDGTNFSITLKANQSVTINNVVVGETYTVTERTSWSWRYESSGVAQKTIDPDATKNVFEITNTLSNNKWLSDTFVKSNHFETAATSTND